MTQQEIIADIQKQVNAGFSREEIQTNLVSKGLPAEMVAESIKSIPVTEEITATPGKKAGNSWVMLLMAVLGFIRAGLQGGQGRNVMMTISIILAVGWLCFFIYEQSKN